MKNNIDKICTSLFLEDHPVLDEAPPFRELYLSALQYFVNLYSNDGFAQAIYHCYEKAFRCNKQENTGHEVATYSAEEIKPIIGSITKTKFKKFRIFSYRYVFTADCLFLCAFHNQADASLVLKTVKALLSPRYHRRLDVLYEALFNAAPLERGMGLVESIVEKWRVNEDFLSQTPERILITATMSAGKSTIINAIIGETLARTAQEACTGDLQFYYNKPFDDQCISGCAIETIYDIDPVTLSKNDCNVDTIAAYFHTITPTKKRVCFIDSPGVNSALNRSHKRVTRKAVKEANYDRLVYIFHAAGGLGREEEAMYLKYIAEIVPKEKTIFVVNKLDDFRKSEDSIESSINGVRADLEKLGYENPRICPLSAYFGLLIKKKMLDIELDEEEQEEFERYTRKFSKPEYDLSSYYAAPEKPINDALTSMSIRCGLYGLERIIMGG